MSEDYLALIVHDTTSHMIASPRSAPAPAPWESEAIGAMDEQVRWIEERAFDHLFGISIDDVVTSDSNDARASRVAVEEVRGMSSVRYSHID